MTAASTQHRQEVTARFTRQNLDQGEFAGQIAAIETSTDVFRAIAKHILDTTLVNREQALALTALEEAKYWTNQSIAQHGVLYQEPTADQAPETSVLNLPIDQDDIPNTPTLGGYLAEILIALLAEGEGFSAKRPLGNSGWEGFIDDALEAHTADTGEDVSWSDVRIAIHEALTGAL